jgi:Ca2+-binding EF-hand superfamily protein
MLSSPAVAEGHGKHHKHQCPAYADIDANADNAVTSEEFYQFRAERMAARAAEGGKMKNAKNAPAFEDLDLDGDGNLSADEFAEHHANCPMRKKQEAAASE